MKVLCHKWTTEGISRTKGQVRILRETWINDPILPTVENGWHLWPDHHTCVTLMGKSRTQNAKRSNKKVFLLAKKFEAQVRSANLELKRRFSRYSTKRSAQVRQLAIQQNLCLNSSTAEANASCQNATLKLSLIVPIAPIKRGNK